MSTPKMHEVSFVRMCMKSHFGWLFGAAQMDGGSFFAVWISTKKVHASAGVFQCIAKMVPPLFSHAYTPYSDGASLLVRNAYRTIDVNYRA